MYIYSKLVRELLDLKHLYDHTVKNSRMWCIRSPVGILRLTIENGTITEAKPSVVSACTLMTQEQAKSAAQALNDAGAGGCIALPWENAVAAHYTDVQERLKAIENEVRFGDERYSSAVRYYWDLTREFDSTKVSYKHPGTARMRYVKRRSK